MTSRGICQSVGVSWRKCEHYRFWTKMVRTKIKPGIKPFLPAILSSTSLTLRQISACSVETTPAQNLRWFWYLAARACSPRWSRASRMSGSLVMAAPVALVEHRMMGRKEGMSLRRCSSGSKSRSSPPPPLLTTTNVSCLDLRTARLYYLAESFKF